MELLILHLIHVPVFLSQHHDNGCGSSKHIFGVLVSMHTKVTYTGEYTKDSIARSSNPAICGNIVVQYYVLETLWIQLGIDRSNTVCQFYTDVGKISLNSFILLFC